MKKLSLVIITMFAVLGTCALLSLSGCAPGELTRPDESLSVTVLQDPVGGQNISTVSATYAVTYDSRADNDYTKFDYPIGIDLHVNITNNLGEPHSAKTTHLGGNCSSGGSCDNYYTDTLTISFTAPSGYLDKTFWATFDWQNVSSDNIFTDTLTSKKAICTVP